MRKAAVIMIILMLLFPSPLKNGAETGEASCTGRLVRIPSCAGMIDDILSTPGPYDDLEEHAAHPDDIVWDGTYYSQLNDFEKAAYDSMYAAVSANETSCITPALEDVDRDEPIERAYTAFLQDHPEFLACDLGYTVYSNGLFEFDVFRFWSSAEDPNVYTQRLEERVKEIAALAENEEDDFHKLLFVYDYIGKHAFYDEARLEESEKEDCDPASELIFTAYGCLVEGSCVCSGYSAALKLVLNELGIRCYQVSGASYGEPHSWNIVEIGGGYYHCDLTWDDGTYYDDDGEEYPGVVSFDYFGLTTEEILEDHSIDEDLLRVPECVSTEYNYYKYFDLMLDDYTLDAALAVVRKQLDMGRNPLVIRFSNEEAYKKCTARGALRRLAGRLDEDYEYFTDDKMLMLSIIVVN